jgi:hypothetical protein
MQVTITFDTAKSTPDEIIGELQALFAVSLQEPIPGQIHMDELPQSTTDQAPSTPAVQTVTAPTATINDSVPEVPDGAIPETPPAPSTTDIQKVVVRLAAAGKKAEVREIVKGYADRVSAIPEDKRAEVLARLSALEG